MFRNCYIVIPILMLATSIASLAQDTAAEPSLQQLKVLTRSAAELYKAKNYAQSAEQIKQAQQLLEQLVADLEKEYTRIERARQLLIDNGQSLPELKPFPGLGSAVAATTPSKPVSSPDASVQVSFTNDVVPVLAKNCGGCHMRQAKGQFSAASYAELIKGTRKGPVVLPGKPDESRLVTLVEDHKMPPRSQGIPLSELQILKDWIVQGAQFDGKDENAKISVPGGAGTSRGPPGPRGEN